MRVHKTPTDLSNVFDTKIFQLISIFSLFFKQNILNILLTLLQTTVVIYTNCTGLCCTFYIDECTDKILELNGRSLQKITNLIYRMCKEYFQRKCVLSSLICRMVTLW